MGLALVISFCIFQDLRKNKETIFLAENHRTQTQFDRHHVAKLIAFESVNNFMSFLYIGFVLKNLELLKQVRGLDYISKFC